MKSDWLHSENVSDDVRVATTRLLDAARAAPPSLPGSKARVRAGIDQRPPGMAMGRLLFASTAGVVGLGRYRRARHRARTAAIAAGENAAIGAAIGAASCRAGCVVAVSATDRGRRGGAGSPYRRSSSRSRHCRVSRRRRRGECARGRGGTPLANGSRWQGRDCARRSRSRGTSRRSAGSR